MNERYLFRGKRKDNGERVIGYYVCVGDKYHYILTGKIDITKKFPEFEKHEVIPETVGQCTGAKLGEQNLFDGDLLSYIGEIYEIVWDENFLVWSVKNKKGDICFNLNTILRDKKRECKLIASKWDNPESFTVIEISKEEYEAETEDEEDE